MLPGDILLVIVELCDPLAIISLCMVRPRSIGEIRSRTNILQQTCKELYSQIYHNRLVWLRCLRVLVAEQCLAPYSLYPDSMSVEELRAHVCRPHRLKASLLNPNGFGLDCEEVHLVYEHVEQGHPSLSPFRFDPVLLPGGRWLLDCVIDLNYAIFALCWDLWSSTSDGCHPVAILPLQLDDVKSWVQQASEDANTVNILLNGTDIHDDWFEILGRPRRNI